MPLNRCACGLPWITQGTGRVCRHCDGTRVHSRITCGFCRNTFPLKL